MDAALYLTELQEEGLIGAVGVTNFDTARLREMVGAGAKIASNQVGAVRAVGAVGAVGIVCGVGTVGGVRG